MFDALANFPWEECRSRYERVRSLIDAATEDITKRDRIYQILWENGGRCDCTVGRNIVDFPDKWSTVKAEIDQVIASPAPEAVVPLLQRQEWKPSIEGMGPARQVGETFVYEGQNRNLQP